jgi:hypothetical protein
VKLKLDENLSPILPMPRHEPGKRIVHAGLPPGTGAAEELDHVQLEPNGHGTLCVAAFGRTRRRFVMSANGTIAAKSFAVSSRAS